MPDNPEILLVADKATDRDTFDVIILDLSFNGVKLIETLKVVKHHDPYIEAVIIAGHADAEKILKAFKPDLFISLYEIRQPSMAWFN